MYLMVISLIRTGGGFRVPVLVMSIPSSIRQRIFSRVWRTAEKDVRLPLKMLMRPRRCVMRFLNLRRNESGSPCKFFFVIGMRKMKNLFIGYAFFFDDGMNISMMTKMYSSNSLRIEMLHTM